MSSRQNAISPLITVQLADPDAGAPLTNNSSTNSDHGGQSLTRGTDKIGNTSATIQEQTSNSVQLVMPGASDRAVSGAAPHTYPPTSSSSSPLSMTIPGTPSLQVGESTSLNTTVTRIPSHDEAENAQWDAGVGPFAVSAHALAHIVASKSLEEIQAIGGLTELAQALRTDTSAGLGSGETADDYDMSDLFEARRETFGVNKTPDKKIKGIVELMLLAFSDRVLILLSVVAVISLAVGLFQSFGQPHKPGEPRYEWVDGVTIMAAVMIVVVTGAANDYQKEKQFSRLNKKKEHRAVKAVRGGKPVEIPVTEILVGDVLYLEPGDLVPADGMLISGHNVRCDESTITGESDQIRKDTTEKALESLFQGHEIGDNSDPFIISGSKILEGVGTYLVTAVGVNSVHGQIQASMTEETEATPLQHKLSIVADKIAIAGVVAATTLFLVLFIKFLVQTPGSNRTSLESLQIFLQIFIVSITIVVIAVPEGLPLAVTLALAIAVTRMLKDNNLVRVLASCETMGNATTVCSDKTGTLTMNKMKVTAGVLGKSSFFAEEIDEYPESPSVHRPDFSFHSTSENQSRLAPATAVDVVSTSRISATISSEMRNVMLQSIAINSTAFEGEEEGIPAFIGSKTEASLLSFARDRLGMGPLQEERANADVVEVLPFDSKTKFMATVIRLSNGKYRLLVKGAPEIIIHHCNQIIPDVSSKLDEKENLGTKLQANLVNIVGNYASQSLRILSLAYKDVLDWPVSDLVDDDDIESTRDAIDGLTLLGIVGIEDPLRPGVSEAVEQCQKAGVVVRMVTGDNVETARAIAMQCGILTEGGVVLDGPSFRQLSPDAMDAMSPMLQVLARSSPEDKRKLVKSLKRLGETVAVTGDGTNDGPALKAADVGFSMGISGTEIAKEASSIVLMDDNFSSILKAIEWGRTVNDAVKKFLNFQITANITSVSVTCVSAILSPDEKSILTPVQLLWVNLIMDTFAALALATDPPSPTVLDRLPERKSAPLISITGWKLIFGQAIYQLVVMLALTLHGPSLLGFKMPQDAPTLETLIFNTYIWMQFFNLYNNRRLDNGINVFQGISKNVYFIVINIVIILGQYLIIQFGQGVLSATSLSAKEWAVSLILGALCMPVAVVLRLIPDSVLRNALNFSFKRRSESQSQQESAVRSGTPWSMALRRVRSELHTIRQPRSSRLTRLRTEISELAKFAIQGAPSIEIEEAEEAADPTERSPLLNVRMNSEAPSREGSVCGASVIMAGLVAGGVAGWPDSGENSDA